MAGILKVDTLQSDSNLALKIATANVAFIDSNGLNVVGGNLTIGATQFAEGGQIQTSGIADDAITSDKILSVANTKISGNITSSQIAPSQTFYGNTSLTGLLDLSATNAGQIKFPASQNASSDANTLDDYEEGTFTPVMTIEGGGTVTLSSDNAFYIKIGSLVCVTMSGVVDAVSGAGAGNAWQFESMPFLSSSDSFINSPLVCRVSNIASSTNFFSGRIFNNATNGRIERFNGTTMGNASDLLQNGTVFDITIIYKAA